MKIIANNYEAKDLVKIVREWSDLSQTKFANSINRSRDSINNIENGRNRIFLNLCNKHNITISIEKKK